MKKFKQFRYTNNIPINQNILTNNEQVIKLTIYALPGTTFAFNTIGNYSMNNTGQFVLDCSVFPIVSLKIINVVGLENNELLYPITIDIEYIDRGVE